jgi:hypothetical protein
LNTLKSFEFNENLAGSENSYLEIDALLERKENQPYTPYNNCFPLNNKSFPLWNNSFIPWSNSFLLWNK